MLALQHLKLEAEENIIKLADRSIILSQKYCTRLYNQLKISKYGNFQKTTEEMREALQKKLQQYGVDHSTGMRFDGQMVVSIISPLMKRAHSLRKAGEMVFLDPSGGMDGHQTRLFLLLTHCPGGEVSLGIKGPMVFMVDDARAEHAAMSTYPDAAILLCSFHVQQAVWRWLWKGNNKVLLRDRNGCMDLFHRLPYSETEGDYLEIYETDNSFYQLYRNTPTMLHIWLHYITAVNFGLCVIGRT